MTDRPDFHVITSDPGLGKANLGDIVAAQNFQHILEASHANVRDEVAIGRTDVPSQSRCLTTANFTIGAKWITRALRALKTYVMD